MPAVGVWVGAGIGFGSLLPPLFAAGPLEPQELRCAELARRVAHHLFGMSEALIEGANNEWMTLGVLGSGELPFTSAALGYVCFGLRIWAVRLPMALWALLGIVAVAALVTRFEGRRAGGYAAAILATMPLFYLQARTMLGDAATLGLHAVALAGLGVAVFAPAAAGRWSHVGRAIPLAIGLGGVVGGYLCRGALFGVAPPTLGVGVAWAIARSTGREGSDRPPWAPGAFVALLGIGSLLLGLFTFAAALQDPARFRLPLGTAVAVAPQAPSFDAVLAQLGQGLFPYGGLLLVAVGQILRGPPATASGSTSAGGVRLVLLATAVVALALHGGLGPYLSPIPFVASAPLAGIMAIALRDAERAGSIAPVIAAGVGGPLLLLLNDRLSHPEVALVAYGVGPLGSAGVAPPDWYVLLVALAAGAIFLIAVDPDEWRRPRRLGPRYRTWFRALLRAHRPWFWALLLSAEAVLVGLSALIGAGRFGLRLPWVEPLGSPARFLLGWGWLFLPGFTVGLGAAFRLGRDLLGGLQSVSGWPRARMLFWVLLLSGLATSLGHYPRLATAASSQGALEAYRAHAQRGEALGLLWLDPAAAVYVLGHRPSVFLAPEVALDWLVSGTERRFLALPRATLAELNALFRQQRRGNLIVVETPAGAAVLATDRLAAGESNRSPCDDVVLDAVRAPSHVVPADLGGVVQSLGWDLIDRGGRSVDVVTPGRAYQLQILWRVTGELGDDWEPFVHLEGRGRRHDAAREETGERYPTRFWRAGDVIADRYTLRFDAHLAAGDYELRYGFSSGRRRLPVERGRHEDHRVWGGKIRVR